MNFTCVLICRNEEKTIRRLMGSLQQFRAQGGEVIIVDTGSTDSTVEVARSLGAKVTEMGDAFRIKIDNAQEINDLFGAPLVKDGDTLFDYSSARNYAASLSLTDWVWAIDADECATVLDLEKINEFLNTDIDRLEYDFVFSHLEDGSPAIAFLHSKFYRKSKMEWRGIIHEVLQDTNGPSKSKYLGSDIIRLEHFQNRETDRSGYLTGLALDCFLHPENDRHSHYLGRELLWRGFHEAAIRELTRHIEMNKWLPEKAQSMIFIGDAYEQLAREERAVEWWMKAFATDPMRREALMKLCEFYFKKNDYHRVNCFAEMSLCVPYQPFYANNQEHYTFKPHEYLYWAKFYLGDFAGSKEHFEIALKFLPNHGKFLHDARFYEELPKVTVILPSLGRPEGLERCLESIRRQNYPAEKIETLVLDDTPRIGVPKRVAEGLLKSTGDVIVFASNDIEFHPDAIILAVLKSKEKALVAMDAGNPEECEHFLIRKDLIPRIGGEIFDTEFNHVGVDNLLMAKAKKLNEFGRCEGKVNHFHFSNGKAEFDEVYAIGWKEEMVKKDRELLKRKLAELNA